MGGSRGGGRCLAARFRGQRRPGRLAPPNSHAIETETTSAKAFGFPVLTRTVLVQRDERGLSEAAQQRVVQRAAAVAKGQLPGVAPIAAVVPIANTSGVFPSSSEQSTTALTYVFTKPGTSLPDEVAAATRFGRQHINQPDDHLVGVTGTVPAQVAQTHMLYGRLPLLEAATLLVVIGIVALKFRSVVAPLVALVTAAASYFLAVRGPTTSAGPCWAVCLRSSHRWCWRWCSAS